MSTPITMEWRIITNGQEVRIIEEQNIFKVTFEGYRLFPIGEMIQVFRKPDSKQFTMAEIVKIIFEDHNTTCYYRLVALKSVN